MEEHGGGRQEVEREKELRLVYKLKKNKKNVGCLNVPHGHARVG